MTFDNDLGTNDQDAQIEELKEELAEAQAGTQQGRIRRAHGHVKRVHGNVANTYSRRDREPGNVATAFAVATLGVLAVGVLGGIGVGIDAAVSSIGSGITFSTGVRDGAVQKISEKGLLCKYWDAQIVLPGISGVGTSGNGSNGTSNIWSVGPYTNQTKIIAQLQAAANNPGEEYQFTYRQTGATPFCGPSSTYDITGVKDLHQKAPGF